MPFLGENGTVEKVRDDAKWTAARYSAVTIENAPGGSES